MPVKKLNSHRYIMLEFNLRETRAILAIALYVLGCKLVNV